MKTRTLFLAAALAIGVPVTLSANSHATPTTTTVIYDDTFHNGYQLNQWNGTNDAASREFAKVGERSIRTMPSQWVGFMLQIPDSARLADRTDLSFWVYGGLAGAESFTVGATADTSRPVAPAQVVESVAAGVWAQRTISLQSLTAGVTSYDAQKDRMLWFTSTSPDTRPAVYFDQIELVDDGTIPPPATAPPATAPPATAPLATAPLATAPPPLTTAPPATAPPTPVTAPPTPTPTPTPVSEVAKPWVIGNYPWYEAADVPPSAFPYDKVTHVQIGNVWPDSPTTCCHAADASFDGFAVEVIATAHAKGKPVILQMGGAGGNPGNVWNTAMASQASMNALADQIVAYAQARGFDGVDLDWEENVIESQETALAKALRARWPQAILVVDVGWTTANLGWAAEMAAAVDRINSMTYVSIGNWGGWDGPWHQGALYENADHSLSTGHAFSIDRTVKAYLAAGVPAAKLGIGIGFGGSGYGDSNKDGDCPTSPTGGWNGEWGAWFGDYQLQLSTIQNLYEGKMTYHWDEVSRTPWLAAGAPGVGGEADGWLPPICYITYEDVRSATEKGQYLRANQLGSIIIWAVPQDKRTDNTYPVLDGLNAGIG